MGEIAFDEEDLARGVGEGVGEGGAGDTRADDDDFGLESVDLVEISMWKLGWYTMLATSVRRRVFGQEARRVSQSRLTSLWLSLGFDGPAGLDVSKLVIMWGLIN